MYKTIFTGLGMALAFTGYAESIIPTTATTAAAAASNAKMTAYLQSQHLPLPGTGVQIVDTKDMHYSKQQQDIQAKIAASIARHGYYKHPTLRAQELLMFKHVAQHQYKQFATLTAKPTDTNLRHNIDDILMAYKFRPVPSVKSIGFSPAGTYLANKGWSGAVEFFTTDLGSCAYTENNMSLTKGAAWIDKSIVTYDVNGKTSIIESEGDGKEFLHRIVWFDAGMIRYELECGVKEFNAQGVLELAKRIDSTTA